MSSESINTQKPNISSSMPEVEKELPKNGVELPKSATDDEIERTESLDGSPNKPKKSFKFKLTIFMICLASVVVSMDSVIVAATLPAITVALRGESLEAFWVGTSYLLSQTAVMLICGSGRKWVMIFSLALFLFGSILCACAQSMTWLIGARVVQGLGGGGCLTLTTVIISDITTLRERPKYLAMGAFAWALGTNIGVPVGGAIGQYTSWKWVFWINIPICVLTIVGLIYALHLNKEISSLRSKMARIDYLGMFIFIASATLFLYGLTTGGTARPWKSGGVLAPLIIGIVGFGLFILIEWRVPEPMVPLRIFSNRTANAGFFGSFIHGLVICFLAHEGILSSNRPPKRFLEGNSPRVYHENIWLIPGTSAPIALSAVFCGIWVAKTLRFQKMTWLAWIILTVGNGLNILMKPDSGPGVIFGMRVVAAVGGGFLFQLPLFGVQATTSDENLGMATSAVTFFRSLGQAFGVAIGGTVFQNQFDRSVAEAVRNGRVPAPYLLTGAQAAGAYGLIQEFPAGIILAYRYIYADSLRVVWYVTTGLSAAGLITSLLVRNENMDRGNNAKQGFKDDKKVLTVSADAV